MRLNTFIITHHVGELEDFDFYDDMERDCSRVPAHAGTSNRSESCHPEECKVDKRGDARAGDAAAAGGPRPTLGGGAAASSKGT